MHGYFGRSPRSRSARRLQFENLESRVVLNGAGMIQDGPVAIVAPTTVATPQQQVATTPPLVATATYLTFHLLPADLIELLTPAQIATIPSEYYFKLLSGEARENLTVAQVQALNVAAMGIDGLPAKQLGYLSAAQVWVVEVVEFKYLGPGVIVHLSAEQLSSFTRASDFNAIPADSRAALTPTQVRSLDVSLLGLSRLTAEQIEYLSPTQIKTLDVSQFNVLSPRQIVHLSPAQLASITTSAQFHVIPGDSRAALTALQVQALDIEIIGLNNLTARQISYLTPQQIKQVTPAQLSYLTAVQIPHVSNAQFAAVTFRGQVTTLSDSALAAMSRAQWLSIPLDILASIVNADVLAPVGFVDPLSAPTASDGLAGDMRTLGERDALFALVPTASATHRSVRSGNWSDPATWAGGQVPSLNASVLIEAGHSVTFDAVMNQAIRTLRINGLLRFAHNRNTKMLVDTIVVDTKGTLHIGTASQPIANNVTAQIVFSAGPINTAWDPRQISRGLSSRGQVRIYGQNVTPYAAFQVAPEAGDTQLFLDRVPTNWKVGDKIVIAGIRDNSNQDEHLTIRGISGNRVTVDPLSYSHVPPAGYGVSTYAANLSRNVIIQSANPNVIAQRGHIMFAHNTDVELVNARLYGLGRTDKTRPLNDPIVVNNVAQPGTGSNARARYPVHFHRTGVDRNDDPALVRGVAVVGSPGWGFVNHSSYVVMEDNVAVNVTGAAFATEDGNEIGAFRRNLAIRSTGSGNPPLSRKGIHDWGHEGHGFWLQGPGVEVVDNIAAGQNNAAFVYFTASSKNLFSSANLDNPSLAAGKGMTLVGSVPLEPFSGNVAFGSGTALEIWYHQQEMNNSPSVLEDFTAWNIRESHVQLWYSGQVTLRDFTLFGDLEAPEGAGIAPNSFTHDLRVENLRAYGFGIGIVATARRTTTVVGGELAAIHGIEVGAAEDSLRTVVVSGNTTFKKLTPSQLHGQQQFDLYLTEPLALSGQNLAQYFSPLAARLGRVILQGQQVYHKAQSQTFVPFPANSVPNFVPDELVGLTNQQLSANFGIAPGGVLAPSGSVNSSRTNGLLGPGTALPVTFALESPASTSQLANYELRYRDRYGDLVIDPIPVSLRPGWNVLTRMIDGQRYSFFVFGSA